MGSLPCMEDAQLSALCDRLREALDSLASDGEQREQHGDLRGPTDPDAPRRLAGGPVVLGDLDDGSGAEDGVVGSCLQVTRRGSRSGCPDDGTAASAELGFRCRALENARGGGHVCA